MSLKEAAKKDPKRTEMGREVLPVEQPSSPVSALDSIDLFSDLSSDALQKIASVCSYREYAPGETILEFGEQGRDVCFLVHGNVQVVNYSPSGCVVSYAVLGRGDFFGELAAIDGQTRSATVNATTDSRVYRLPYLEFWDLVNSQKKVNAKFYQKWPQ